MTGLCVPALTWLYFPIKDPPPKEAGPVPIQCEQTPNTGLVLIIEGPEIFGSGPRTLEHSGYRVVATKVSVAVLSLASWS
jgi:hypothetical protein